MINYKESWPYDFEKNVRTILTYVENGRLTDEVVTYVKLRLGSLLDSYKRIKKLDSIVEITGGYILSKWIEDYDSLDLEPIIFYSCTIGIVDGVRRESIGIRLDQSERDKKIAYEIFPQNNKKGKH